VVLWMLRIEVSADLMDAIEEEWDELGVEDSEA
jgi:hypothetical protein